MRKIAIVDTFGVLFRAFYAIKGLSNSKGLATGMISGFATFLQTLESDDSDLIIFALDSKGKGFRNEIDPNYKQNREAPPKELKDQLEVCIKMIEQMGLASLSVDGYEADDIIASLVKAAKNKDIFISIITTDKDLYQLIEDKRVEIFSPISKRRYDEAACMEKYGVPPAKIRDFLALMGDSSDNIPGVKGIGAKGAKRLLDDFNNLEDIYENLTIVGNERTKRLLKEGKENAFKSKALATLYEELDCSYLLELERPLNPLLKVRDILEFYELKNILRKLDFTNTQQKKVENKLSFKSILVKDEAILRKLLENLSTDTLVAFDTESTGLDANTALLVGFSFAFNLEEGFYVPFNHVDFKMDKELVIWAIKQIYKAFVIGHNIKYDFLLIEKNLGLSLPKKYADTMLLAWLHDPFKRVNMNELAKRYFDYSCLSFEELVPKGSTFGDLPLNKACFYAAEDAVITLKFYLYLLKKLNKDELKLARDLEFPFIKIIMMMEANGFLLDTKELLKLKNELSIYKDNLSEEIYKLANERFNINSPKQVGELLFDKLGLKASQKSKIGYKTDESVLLPLKKEHEVVAKILEYRELSKLIGTYCEPLLLKVDEKDRIHSHFLQCGTATGRLASKDPNLQNIPSRGRYAKAYKTCFIAKEGFSLLSLDYSQIELRLLAHFSKDEALLKAFKEDKDIHANTAINIFGYCDEKSRQVAKSINFGLIYGMGKNALARNLDISIEEAKSYIDKYFASFPSIKEYFAKTKKKAKEDGFISTLFKRRRYFDFNTPNPRLLAMYERECINSILQGSAADIIKLAMYRLKAHLDEEHFLLLQIHDELIFEIKDKQIEKFSKIARNLMQNSVKLELNLKSSLKVGKNWGELKEYKWT